MKQFFCLLLACCCLLTTVYAQDVSVTGKVTNQEEGTPIEGVNVTATAPVAYGYRY